jgi:hypothetical protein
MKALLRSALSAIAILAFPVFAQASAPSAWYSNVTITAIYSGNHGSGRVAIKVNTTIPNGTCPAGGEMQLDTESPYFWSMFALAMSAYKSATPINVHTDGTCGQFGVMLSNLQLGGSL